MPALEGRSIAFVNNFPGPGLGGGEVHLLAVVDACVGAGMSVRVLCPEAGDVARAVADAGAEPVACRFGAGLAAALADTRRELARAVPDVVHATGWLTGRLAQWSAPRGVALVETVHVMPHAPALDGTSRAGMVLRDVAERLRRSRTDAYLPVSQAVADALVGRGVDPGRVRVIRNGVDVAELRRLAVSGPGVGLPQGRRMVGVLARLEPVKGVSTFVRAAAALAERDDVAFVVAGDGSGSRALEDEAAALGLGDRMVFAKEVASSAGLLASLDVLCVPSLSEGFGLVAIEAGALGVPVVASAVDGLAEIVSDGETGLLVPAGDPQALSAGISRLLDDEGLRADMGARARERVERGFSLAAMREAHLRLYGEMPARARGRA